MHDLAERERVAEMARKMREDAERLELLSRGLMFLETFSIHLRPMVGLAEGAGFAGAREAVEIVTEQIAAGWNERLAAATAAARAELEEMLGEQEIKEEAVATAEDFAIRASRDEGLDF